MTAVRLVRRFIASARPRLMPECSRPAKLPTSCGFFFNDTATTEIYTLSLHDALPISARSTATGCCGCAGRAPRSSWSRCREYAYPVSERSGHGRRARWHVVDHIRASGAVPARLARCGAGSAPGWRLPQLEPVSFSVDRPAEPAVRCLPDLVNHLGPARAQLGQHGSEVIDPVVDHIRLVTPAEVFGVGREHSPGR